MRISRHRLPLARLAVAATAALCLAACAPAPAPTVTVTEAGPGASAGPTPGPAPAVTVTVTATANGAPGPMDPSVWLITFQGIGPFNVAQTADDIEVITGNDYSSMLTDFGGYCAEFPLGPSGVLNDMHALAESGGATGTVDRVTVGDWEGTGTGYPQTQAGITIGSTKAQVLAAYPTALIQPYLYDETWERIKVEHGTYGMLFLVNDADIVVWIAAGRQNQYAYVEGCA